MVGAEEKMKFKEKRSRVVGENNFPFSVLGLKKQLCFFVLLYVIRLFFRWVIVACKLHF